jgi:hypothetical protein
VPAVFQKYRRNQNQARAGTSDGGEWVDEGVAAHGDP